MNEHLKELMLEAGYAAPELAGRANKLAELIVKKCVMVGNYAYDGGEYPGPMIKEYFGIDKKTD